MIPRLLKVRVTDFRPPGAVTPPPLERTPARPEAAAWEKAMSDITRAEAASHDAWVRDLSPQSVLGAARDLCQTPAWDRTNERHRWVMGRRAALLRRINREKLTPTSAP